MDWPSDPWVKASYSFPAPGQVTAQGPTLRQGIGRLHFAGEYTSYAFMGYMEGALDSGAAVARRIAVKDGVAERSRGMRPSESPSAVAGPRRRSWSCSRPAIVEPGQQTRREERAEVAAKQIDEELAPQKTVDGPGGTGGGDR